MKVALSVNTAKAGMLARKSAFHSAEGASYNSQGKREPSEARRPWLAEVKRRALKVRNINVHISLLQSLLAIVFTRGDAHRFARACPWLVYFAPSALTCGMFKARLLQAKGTSGAFPNETTAKAITKALDTIERFMNWKGRFSFNTFKVSVNANST